MLCRWIGSSVLRGVPGRPRSLYLYRCGWWASTGDVCGRHDVQRRIVCLAVPRIEPRLLHRRTPGAIFTVLDSDGSEILTVALGGDGGRVIEPEEPTG